MHVSWTLLAKTRGIKYFNVETWMLFAPPIKISGYAPDLSEIVLAQAIVYSKENLSFVVVLLSASSWFVFL